MVSQEQYSDPVISCEHSQTFVAAEGLARDVRCCVHTSSLYFASQKAYSADCVKGNTHCNSLRAGVLITQGPEEHSVHMYCQYILER